MDVFEAVNKRRSIRKYRDTPVPYEVLERCVDAARLAPTAMNCQLLEYVVVDDEQLLPQVLNAVGAFGGRPRPEEGWQPEGRPKAYIVTLINCQLESEFKVGRTNTNYDVGLAMENMMLVALEKGIGTLTIGSFDHDKLRQVLNIPDKYEIALGLALGFPDESPVLEVATDSVKHWTDDIGVRHVPKRRLTDVVHRNRFVP